MTKQLYQKSQKLVGDNNSNRMQINQNKWHFQFKLMPERKKIQSRECVLAITKEPNETADNVRSRLFHTEKICLFDFVTPTELNLLKN